MTTNILKTYEFNFLGARTSVKSSTVTVYSYLLNIGAFVNVCLFGFSFEKLQLAGRELLTTALRHVQDGKMLRKFNDYSGGGGSL
jgi:hypothetical protein